MSTSSRRPGPKAYLLITLFAFLLVLFPFLFWYYTWFGRRLSAGDLDQYFADKSHPRHAQHALVQLSDQLAHHENVSRWYPAVVLEATSPNLELRETAAWVMGQDASYAPFHQALLQLIHDPAPMVRRNAAPALATFNDPAGRSELDAMLQPYTIPVPLAGKVQYRLKVGNYVNPGTLIAHIGDTEIRSSVPGEVRSIDRRNGDTVKPGDDLAELSADPNHVWEALRALYIVGQAPDLQFVQRFARPIPGMPDKIARQAQLTAEAIQQRAAH
ncbi:MAG TPA: HEAT repeat domain-containing protein [Bryobacteraceae bacterium]|jgi:biotin carboxyl carrier protein|nr:HEAT repeat domain-containing protein [Bryobacteraceae bacterium]